MTPLLPDNGTGLNLLVAAAAVAAADRAVDKLAVAVDDKPAAAAAAAAVVVAVAAAAAGAGGLVPHMCTALQPAAPVRTPLPAAAHTAQADPCLHRTAPGYLWLHHGYRQPGQAAVHTGQAAVHTGQAAVHTGQAGPSQVQGHVHVLRRHCPHVDVHVGVDVHVDVHVGVERLRGDEWQRQTPRCPPLATEHGGTLQVGEG